MMKWGLYIWKKVAGSWERQPEHEKTGIVSDECAWLHFDARHRLPLIDTDEERYVPPKKTDELHPAHRDGWYLSRLPAGYQFHIAEGVALPDTERLIFVWFSAQGREWLVVAGLGVNEYEGDNRPDEAQCLATAVGVREHHLFQLYGKE